MSHNYLWFPIQKSHNLKISFHLFIPNKGQIRIVKKVDWWDRATSVGAICNLQGRGSYRCCVKCGNPEKLSGCGKPGSSSTCQQVIKSTLWITGTVTKHILKGFGKENYLWTLTIVKVLTKLMVLKHPLDGFSISIVWNQYRWCLPGGTQRGEGR